MSKSALELFLAAKPVEVKAPKSGKAVVREATEAELRQCCPAFVDGLLDPAGKPWAWADAHGIEHVGMLVTVTESMPRWFGRVGSKFVTYPMCGISPEIAKALLVRLGKGNRNQQKTTLDRYIASQKSGENHNDSGWSFVGNSFIFTAEPNGSMLLRSDSMHNGGHTSTALLESGASILANLQFGIPSTDVARIDDNRSRDDASVIETLRPFAGLAKQPLKVCGVVTSITKTQTQLDSIQKTVFGPALRILRLVRMGESPKKSMVMDRGETYEEAKEYQAVLVRACQTVCALFADNKVFQRHQLVAAMVLGCTDEGEDGSLVWNEEAERAFTEIFAQAANPDIVDESLPMVSLRETFRAWSTAKQNTNGSGMDKRWVCLKLAIINAINGIPVNRAQFDLQKATDHNKDSLRLGGIDDYVSPADAAMLATKTGTSTVPAPLFAEEEKVD